MGEYEPEIENILEFNEEFYVVTPEPSQDTELIEMEPQQQENEEFNHDVATQEPTSLEISVETLRMQQESNPRMDIIPDMDLGKNEQLQSQSSRDTKILEEQLHIEKDMTTTLQSQQHEEREGQGSVTQEPTALHPPVEAATDNQTDKEIKIQGEVVTQEPTPSQSVVEVAIKELQKEDVVT